MTHTPGEWEVHLMAQANYPGKRWGVYGPEMEYVAACDAVGEGQDAKNEANARLIAAAPDLLEALKEMARLDQWRHSPEWLDNPSCRVNLDAAITNAIAAITKAEGD